MLIELQSKDGLVPNLNEPTYKERSRTALLSQKEISVLPRRGKAAQGHPDGAQATAKFSVHNVQCPFMYDTTPI